MKLTAQRLILTLLSACFLASSVAGAEDQGGSGDRYLYQWTDEKGNAYITDRIESVPAKYRSRVRIVQQPGASDQSDQGPQAQQPSSAPAPSESDVRGAEADAKEEWQNRMRDAKRRLDSATQRYTHLEQRKAEITAQWGSSGAALPPQEVLDKLNQIEIDMQRVRKEIDEIKNEINTVIPDEARKAGVPPGWLREVQ
jgi:hypothetical protein